jgi:midasin (ATPase involved in ribosome maturation)
MTKKFSKKQLEFIQAARSVYGNEIDRMGRSAILDICAQFNLNEPQWMIKRENNTGQRGIYYLPMLETKASVKPASVNKTDTPTDEPKFENILAMTNKNNDVSSKKIALSDSVYENTIPSRDKNFVRFGIYKDLHTIIASRQFYPVFISGLSGNGKSFTPEQICAELKIPFFRVNIQKHTNEDDLLGGFRLVNGQTVWFDGPVTQAAEVGGLLVLDEIDYGSAELTCLQGVLEGKPFLIKKVNKIVVPKRGFNIVATANTKGQGDQVGKFVFTNVMNEAFLERFAVTLTQEYPPEGTEEKILKNYFKSLEVNDTVYGDFPQKLVKWANANRDTFRQNGITEVISTRRLVHIVKAFTMFNDRKKAVEICLNRFDDESRSALFDLYKKIDAAPVEVAKVKEAEADPFLPDADGGIVF